MQLWAQGRSPPCGPLPGGGGGRPKPDRSSSKTSAASPAPSCQGRSSRRRPGSDRAGWAAMAARAGLQLGCGAGAWGAVASSGGGGGSGASLRLQHCVHRCDETYVLICNDQRRAELLAQLNHNCNVTQQAACERIREARVVKRTARCPSSIRHLQPPRPLHSALQRVAGRYLARRGTTSSPKQ